MKIKTKENKKHMTKDKDDLINGFLIPIYNEKENFFKHGEEPKQVYLTVVAPGCIKGPHLHKIRKGFFTCVKGDVRIVLKINGSYVEYFSGDNYKFLSIEVPTNVPAAIQNIGKEDAYVLNMPSPAWDPNMDDEYTDDFADFDFTKF